MTIKLSQHISEQNPVIVIFIKFIAVLLEYYQTLIYKMLEIAEEFFYFLFFTIQGSQGSQILTAGKLQLCRSGHFP